MQALQRFNMIFGRVAVEIQTAVLEVKHENIQSAFGAYIGVKLTKRPGRRVARVGQQRLTTALALGVEPGEKDIMTQPAISIDPEESAEVAARTLTHYNIGILPVCSSDGSLRGVVTDRDLVTRCLASGLAPERTKVRDVMTGQVVTAGGDMDTGAAAHLMGRLQVRRLPVVENGALCGMVSLGDLANREDSCMDAADALTDICANISAR